MDVIWNGYFPHSLTGLRERQRERERERERKRDKERNLSHPILDLKFSTSIFHFRILSPTPIFSHRVLDQNWKMDGKNFKSGNGHEKFKLFEETGDVCDRP